MSEFCVNFRYLFAAGTEHIAKAALFDDAINRGKDERQVATIANAFQGAVSAAAEDQQYDEDPQAGIITESSETVH